MILFLCLYFADPSSESRSAFVYVPRDENFSEVKGLTFSGKTLYSVLHAVVPNLKSVVTDLDFPYFTTIDKLYNEGVHLPDDATGHVLTNILPRLVKTTSNAANNVLQYETPEMLDSKSRTFGDKFSWFRDEEFARQALAGLHPSSIQLVTEWPMKSKLDPTVYGAPESAITKEIVEKEIRGYMTVEEAIEQKKLFVIDYHDLLLPHVNKVRELNGTTLYGSRTLFFLTPDGTLRPLAIELVRPQGTVNGKQQEEWRHVFTPCWDATGTWLWRTHCATEPYIIATNRQLSAMHPIYRLIHPHFRYTMEINALARVALINAEGIIETAFSPKKYSMELCSDAYDKLWRFDHESLPGDLISRGMAVADPNSPHGLQLTIEDYPYASDGLVLWDAIKEWVSNYVNHFYTEASLVESDKELQAWWTEIRTVGHQDKKDEPWWPVLKTQQDLIEIVSTIIFVASGHHAAVNFGQYDFAGYFPNRPTIARTKMPNEDATDEEVAAFLKRPESALMQCFPTQFQATAVMAILDVLSNHSPDEEYMGTTEPFYEEDQNLKAAFEKFSGRLKELEGIIDARNGDKNLKNRSGAGIVPYNLFKPTSEPGVTGQGVPKSISI
ncbi:hypothetical protein Leryth_005680 [Lithospermum erythrorhizon]|nr:hypothetical protein Leryth_005680 [Lithospermum erythrorhizon]